MKLLIPSQCIELTGEVQRVLLLAEQQGFAIGHIELGVSPTPYLQLVGDTTLSLSCNWFTHVQPDADWVLHYGAAAKDLPAPHVHDGWILLAKSRTKAVLLIVGNIQTKSVTCFRLTRWNLPTVGVI